MLDPLLDLFRQSDPTTVDFGTVWLHEWELSIGGPSRTVLPSTMPLERVTR